MQTFTGIGNHYLVILDVNVLASTVLSIFSLVQTHNHLLIRSKILSNLMISFELLNTLTSHLNNCDLQFSSFRVEEFAQL
jgi:predicted nucleic acid-binding protein